MSVEIAKIKRDTHEIKTALTGNMMGMKGLVPRMDEAEQKIENHDRKLLVWGALITAAGVSAQFLKDLVFHGK